MILGCGYGALLDLSERTSYPRFTYCGFDVSDEHGRAPPELVTRRRSPVPLRSGMPRRRQIADYGIASGIFNVRLDRSDAEWRDYLEATLDVLDRTSRRGFAFNCLTSYSDADKMRDYLYYADPCALFRPSASAAIPRNVALAARLWPVRIHDPGEEAAMNKPLVIFGAGDIAQLAHFYFTPRLGIRGRGIHRRCRVHEGSHVLRPAGGGIRGGGDAISARRTTTCSSR